MSIPQHDRFGMRPSAQAAAERGCVLGGCASLVTIFLVPAIVLLLFRFGYWTAGEGSYALLFFGIVIFMVTCVPYMAGGALSGLLMYRLAERHTLRIPVAMLLGASLYAVWGLAAMVLSVGLAWGTTPGGFHESIWQSVRLELPWLEGLSIPLGAWHGWRLARYFQKAIKLPA